MINDASETGTTKTGEVLISGSPVFFGYLLYIAIAICRFIPLRRCFAQSLLIKFTQNASI